MLIYRNVFQAGESVTQSPPGVHTPSCARPDDRTSLGFSFLICERVYVLKDLGLPQSDVMRIFK